MASTRNPGLLSSFADAEHLSAGTDGDLPHSGSLLERSDVVIKGAAHGALPGGRSGTVFLATYVTRTDDSSTTHNKTAVLMRVPESMGYAPT